MSLVLLFVLLSEFHLRDFGVDICFQVIAFGLLPSVTVGLHSSKSENSVLRSEFAILAHRVQAADKLDFLSLVGLHVDAVPLFSVWFESLTISFGLLLKLCLLSLEFDLLLALKAELLIDSKLVCNTSIKRCLEQASLVF